MVVNGGKMRTKGEQRRRNRFIRFSRNLADFLRLGPTPTSSDEVGGSAVNRRVASSNLARGANLLLIFQTLTTASDSGEFGTLGTTSTVPAFGNSKPGPIRSATSARNFVSLAIFSFRSRHQSRRMNGLRALGDEAFLTSGSLRSTTAVRARFSTLV
jgi:hypothetical protein